MKKILLSILLLFGFVATVNAAGSLSVRVEQPKSPTASKSFQVDFVALDIESRSVAVECYIKKPGGSFIMFDSKLLASGGSSGVCQVSESDMPDLGSYDYYVKAIAGSDISTSLTVSVDFDDRSPGTPSNYTRETISSCQYRVKFRTASDSGVTNKVVLYRSDTTPYNADDSTKVSEIGIGSDQNGEFVNTVPDCNKTYYFSIRAFNSSGVGSGITGDPDATVQVLSATDDSTASGAVVTSDSQVTSGTGQILGEEDDGDDSVSEVDDHEDIEIDVDIDVDFDKEESGVGLLDRLIGNVTTLSSKSLIIVVPAVGIPVILIIVLVALILRDRNK